MANNTLFGVPPSTLATTLRKAENALAATLGGYHTARIAWPSSYKQIELAQLVEAREPLPKHIIGLIDGKNLRVIQPSSADLQNAMYNGWAHTVLVTGTICFAADGCIIWSRHNYSGFLDPGFCPNTRMNVVSDSAFPCSTGMTGRTLSFLKDEDIDRIEPSLRIAARTMHNAVISVRQAAEWGMGSIQKVYNRADLPLPYAPRSGLRINNMLCLAKYRARTVSISQIQTVLSGDMELNSTSQ